MIYSFMSTFILWHQASLRLLATTPHHVLLLVIKKHPDLHFFINLGYFYSFLAQFVL